MARLDTKQAAKYLFGEDGKPGTLDQWRYRKVGPTFIKLGRLVRYEQTDLDEWLARHTQHIAGDGTSMEGRTKYVP
jgi:hypothetical protein